MCFSKNRVNLSCRMECCLIGIFFCICFHTVVINIVLQFLNTCFVLCWSHWQAVKIMQKQIFCKKSAGKNVYIRVNKLQGILFHLKLRSFIIILTLEIITGCLQSNIFNVYQVVCKASHWFCSSLLVQG